MTNSVRPSAQHTLNSASRARAHTHTRRRAASAAFRASACLLLGLLLVTPALADTLLLRPGRVFDGVNPQAHEGWSVVVVDDRIAAVGPNLAAPAGARTIDLPGATLLPGMIE